MRRGGAEAAGEQALQSRPRGLNVRRNSSAGARRAVCPIDRLLDRGAVGGHNPLDFLVAPGEPVGGPDADEAPAEALEMLLAEAITITDRRCGMVRSAIALDREDMPAGLLGVVGDKVDAVMRHAV